MSEILGIDDEKMQCDEEQGGLINQEGPAGDAANDEKRMEEEQQDTVEEMINVHEELRDRIQELEEHEQKPPTRRQETKRDAVRRQTEERSRNVMHDRKTAANKHNEARLSMAEDRKRKAQERHDKQIADQVWLFSCRNCAYCH